MIRPVLFLVGPTGVGKSDLALDLAKSLEGEIISADSMQIYRGMDIGTAKPTVNDRSLVPHHLIDLKNPDEEFSAYEFCQLALKAIADIYSRGKLPIVCGGTGFYIRALIDGLPPQENRSDKVRECLLKRVEKEGLPALYTELVHADPARASKIHANDQKRILRALEIIQITGDKASAATKAASPLEHLGYRPVVWGIHRSREALYERINLRVQFMFNQGLIKEITGLVSSGVVFSNTSRFAVGYREVLNTIDRRAPLDPSILIPLIQTNTRHLARRQLIWFRKERGIQWVDLSSHSQPHKVLIDSVR